MDVIGPPPALALHMRWRLAPTATSPADAPTVERLERWLTTGHATLVKHGRQRTVYRIDLAGETVYLKHEQGSGWRTWLRRWFRAPATRREFTHAEALRQRHVPAIEPLALGEVHRAGRVRDSYLVTAAVRDTVSLDTFLQQWLPTFSSPTAARVTRQLAESLARLCAAAHRAGVVHDDLHSGNVLVETAFVDDANSPPTLRLADLPDVRLRATLDWRRSRHNLAIVTSQYLGRASLRLRWRFWRTYLRERPELQLDARRAAAELDREAAKHYCRNLARRDKRSLADNRDFVRLRTATGAGHAVRGLDATVLSRWLADPRAALVGMMLRTFAPRDGWRWPWQSGPALTAWRAGHALLARGIATPRPLAVLTPEGDEPARLLVERLAGATSLRASWGRPRRTLAAALGELVGRLHAWNIHLAAADVNRWLVVERQGRLTVYVDDPAVLSWESHLTDREQLRDLRRIEQRLAEAVDLSRSERLRFLRAYVAAYRAAPSGGRRFDRPADVREFYVATDSSATTTSSAVGT